MLSHKASSSPVWAVGAAVSNIVTSTVKKEKMPSRYKCERTRACALRIHVHARPQVNGYLICVVRMLCSLKRIEILWEWFHFNSRYGAASE